MFSYITLQHCERADALALTSEALRVVKPGGVVVLNYRTWIPDDVVLYPAGVLTRALWRVPTLGPWLARQRWSTRLGWQANRLAPRFVFEHLAASGVALDSPTVWLKNERRLRGVESVPEIGRAHV